MNFIFGLVNFDSVPAADLLEAMRVGLGEWSSDSGVWSAGSYGLGCLHLPGTPEAVGERLPLVQDQTGLVLTAGARLDNRDDLLDQLQIQGHGLRLAITDAELILGAFQHWGEDCVRHLEGAWHFAVLDQRQHRLFLARDHHNNTGLYYYQSREFFAFASSKKALLRLGALPQKPDLLRISQVLVAWPGNGVQTCYEQIFRLPPAHRMVIESDRTRVERYWFPENVAEMHLNSEEAYVEAFLEAFIRAVTVRLRSHRPLGVTLSGGLDSGSVAAVASSILQGRNDTLTALTSVPLSDPRRYTDRSRDGDEARLAQDTTRQAGIREHVFVGAEKITPMAGIEHMLTVHDEPLHAAGNQFWLMALLDAAREREVGVLLTGQMGNAVISWTGAGVSLVHLLLSDILPFKSHPQGVGFWQAFEIARTNAGLDRWHAVRRFLIKPLFLSPWTNFRKRWRIGSQAWRGYSAIRQEFAREIGLSQKMSEAGYLPGLVTTDPLQQRLAIIQPGQNILGASWLEKGAAYQLEVRDPTQDRRLIELCLSIPETQYQHDGLDRWLIRRAMQNYLPDSVRLNPRRGLQAADLGQRVLDSHGEITSVLNRLDQHELARQVLDIPRMRMVLISLEHGLTTQNFWESNTILLRGLMAGLFLLRF